jgi:hypothetical protein
MRIVRVLFALSIATYGSGLGLQSALAASPACDEQCLTKSVASYWAALLAHRPEQINHSASLKFTENDVPLQLGEGLWHTITGAETQDIVFTDVPHGVVATTAVVKEGVRPALLIARLKVVHGAISEIETVVARKETSTFLRPDGWYSSRARLVATINPSERRGRLELVRIADSYFDRIADPSRPLPSLEASCDRIENGLQTTHNPDPFPGVSPAPLSPAISRLGCAEQLELKTLSFVSRVRDRRYVMVDESRGLILSFVMFDHDGAAAASDATRNGSGSPKLSTPQPSPYSYVVGEIFKIEDSKIVLVQALLTQVPFGMRSIW